MSACAVLVAACLAASSGPVVDGPVRAEVVTPSLIRLEHAADGRFEDRRTLLTEGRRRTRPVFTTRVRAGERIIRTSRMTVRWRRRAGPFPAGLRVRVGDRVLRPRLGPNPAPLGGWRRSLDLVDGPVALHEGVLSRAGWYLLDDSASALVEGDRWTARPARDGAYQDLYLFAYGRDYARALRDLRTLTGPAPLLPRKAFGVWFSRWWPYGDAEWRALVRRFREERVPLDTISLDTDFKRVNDPAGAAIAAAVLGTPGRPYSWNGWDWNRSLFPDPAGFLDWAHDAGLDAGLNVHPSIDDRDPRHPGGLAEDEGCRVVQADPTGRCTVFDWADAGQLATYFGLHEPFERDGADFWWLDWCCDGSRVSAPGLTPDTWINRAYFRRSRARGSRWPAFQRIGGSLQAGFGGAVGTGAFAEHRTTLQFTGDTCASWPLLAFASEVTAAAGSIGLPYVSHDIGTFHGVVPTCDAQATPPLAAQDGNRLPADMYVRWLQLGAFQPLDRLHSNHGRRLPWEYGGEAGEIAAEFLRLREALVPYLYSVAREAVDTGLPMARALYLSWPGQDAAYEHPSQYTLGRDVLVAPVSAPGDPAPVDVWIPPGTWVDWFTGEVLRGPRVVRRTVPLSRLPVLVRAGGIVPTQPPVRTTPVGPPRALVVTAWAGTGRTVLYDDAGDGLAYLRGRATRTTITQRRRGRSTVVRIGRARGRFDVEPTARSWTVRVVGVRRPRTVTVAGRRTARWRYDAASRTVRVPTGLRSTRRPFALVIR